MDYNCTLCSNAQPPLRVTRSRIVVLLLLFVVVWFAGLDDRALTRPDEGRYSEIPREMAVTGDWVTPRLNGLKYFEKPPLQYCCLLYTSPSPRD